MLWLSSVALSTSASSAGSAKASHHWPRAWASAGRAWVQPACGAAPCSLKAGAAGSSGRLWDTLAQPARASAATRGSRRLDSFESDGIFMRSEEHTSELQSQSNLVCRLLLEKKK